MDYLLGCLVQDQCFYLHVLVKVKVDKATEESKKKKVSLSSFICHNPRRNKYLVSLLERREKKTWSSTSTIGGKENISRLNVISLLQ